MCNFFRKKKTPTIVIKREKQIKFTAVQILSYCFHVTHFRIYDVTRI